MRAPIQQHLAQHAPVDVGADALAPYLYSGRRYDPETGLYWYRTRYFDPHVGRFCSRDTIGIWGDATALGNGQVYVSNNPYSFVDPYGLDASAAWVFIETSFDAVMTGIDVIDTVVDAGAVVINSAEVIVDAASVAFDAYSGAPINLAEVNELNETLVELDQSLDDLGESSSNLAADAVGLALPGIPSPRAMTAVTEEFATNKALRKSVGELFDDFRCWSTRRPWKENKPNRKKQGREPGEKKRQNPNWKPRNPPKEPPKHTPSRKD